MHRAHELSTVCLAVAGVGGWGRNLARNYSQIPGCNLRYICDTSPAALTRMQATTPGALATTSFDQLLRDPVVQAVVVATPAGTHYALCKAALLAGKDVYVEKPFVLEVAHAEELVHIAKQEGRILMVGHLLEYHPVINRLKEMIDSNELGDIYYFYNQRVNLGDDARRRERAVELRAARHLVDSVPARHGTDRRVGERAVVSATRRRGRSCSCTLNFNGRAMAHIHVSWLDPHKVRKMTIVGSQKMAVFDDFDANEKLQIYDKGAATTATTTPSPSTSRCASATSPSRISRWASRCELECLHFLECVVSARNRAAMATTDCVSCRVLDAAQRSLRSNGTPIVLEPALCGV